jgi:hypothetical protein
MEDELWEPLYQLIWSESNRRGRRGGTRFCDAWIVLVFFWAVLHDRPISWACRQQHWPLRERWRVFPSPATMSRRMRCVSVLKLMEAIWLGLSERSGQPLVRVVDAKPLPVGGFSKDIDAKWGQAVDAKAKGYKLYSVWGRGSSVPEQWRLGPMNESEPLVAEIMIRRLRGGGYLLGDSLYDTNPLHRLCGGCGLQLLAPRKKPGTQLGHQDHDASRLRAIELLETRPRLPLPRGTDGADAARNFGPGLYACRTTIEREFGQMGNFGGGLSPLPNWVRRPHRVAVWVAAKLVINGLRICRNKGVAA